MRSLDDDRGDKRKMVGVQHVAVQDPEVLERQTGREDDVVGGDVPQGRLGPEPFRAIRHGEARRLEHVVCQPAPL